MKRKISIISGVVGKKEVGFGENQSIFREKDAFFRKLLTDVRIFVKIAWVIL